MKAVIATAVVWAVVAVSLLAVAAAPPAARPGLELPAEVAAAPGELIVLRAKTGAKAVRWCALDGGLQLVPAELLASPSVAVAVAARPGTYRVLAVGCAGDELAGPAICTVRIGEEDPQTRPPPARAGRAVVLIVEETGQATARRGAVLSSPDLGAYLRARGWSLRMADRDARDPAGRVPADLAPYLRAAEGKRLPRLFVVGGDGSLLHEGDAPPSAAGLLALLKGIGG